MDERNSLRSASRLPVDHLHAIAWRILGSRTEAEDAVHESWLRLASVDVAIIRQCSRVAHPRLFPASASETLRARKSRRAAPLGADAEAVPSTDEQRNAGA